MDQRVGPIAGVSLEIPILVDCTFGPNFTFVTLALSEAEDEDTPRPTSVVELTFPRVVELRAFHLLDQKAYPEMLGSMGERSAPEAVRKSVPPEFPGYYLTDLAFRPETHYGATWVVDRSLDRQPMLVWVSSGGFHLEFLHFGEVKVEDKGPWVPRRD